MFGQENSSFIMLCYVFYDKLLFRLCYLSFPVLAENLGHNNDQLYHLLMKFDQAILLLFLSSGLKTGL